MIDEIKEYEIHSPDDDDERFFIKDVEITPIFRRLKATSCGESLERTADGNVVLNTILKLIIVIESCINQAEVLGFSFSPTESLQRLFYDFKGMSSIKNRIFLNALCSDTSNSVINNKNYLEIGCASGSTYISANSENNLNSSYVCDLFLEKKNGMDGKDIFLENCLEHLGEIPKNLFVENCFSLNLDKIKDKINIYFYDGGHSVKDHEMALTYFEKVFDDHVIFIIDDWNDTRVQLGTLLGLSKIGYSLSWWHYCPANVHYAPFAGIYFERSQLSSKTIFGDSARWWNGLMIMLLSKGDETK